MKDMLVPLWELPECSDIEKRLQNQENIIVRRPIAAERHLITSWVLKNFSNYWESEVKVAFRSIPASIYVAQKNNEILGFACYECTARGFFGPTGTLEEERGKGIGKVLLVKSLQSLREMGYVYGIIGGVGPEAYYEKTVNARIIEGSEKSVYYHMLKNKNGGNKKE
ncbi:GNAT family N-acetyltransferase [Flavobacteriaceae bacterium M23B6Z8]